MRLLALTILWLASCGGPGGVGDECIDPGQCAVGLYCMGGTCVDLMLECGEGTEEVNGTCQAPARRQCGRGTIEVEGVCVPEPLGEGE